MKSIKYTVTEDDFVAFNMHTINYAPSIRKRLLIRRILFSFMLTIAIGVMALGTLGFRVASIIAMAAVFVFGWFLYSFLMNRSWKNAARKHATNMVGNDYFGEHHLIQMDDTLQQETSVGTAAFYYDKLSRIDETDTHIFIYISERSGIIIPKQNMVTDELESFMDALHHNLSPKVPYTHM